MLGVVVTPLDGFNHAKAFSMNLATTALIIATAMVALSACAQMPSATSTPPPPGAASAQGMPAAPAGERMAMMDAHMKWLSLRTAAGSFRTHGVGVSKFDASEPE